MVLVQFCRRCAATVVYVNVVCASVTSLLEMSERGTLVSTVKSVRHVLASVGKLVFTNLSQCHCFIVV